MMYLDHFGLTTPPFSISPDPAFAYPSRAQRQAHATLLHAIDDGVAFVKITGMAGTGKTLACRLLLAALAGSGRRLDTAYIANPCLTPRSLLLAIGVALNLPLRADASEPTMLALLQRALHKAAAADRRVVVCLDEAQAMPPDALEVLQRLATAPTAGRGLLQIALFGQPELESRLARPDLRGLASRITAHYRLEALSAPETEAYLAHRLRMAGRAEDATPLFPTAVAALVHRHARGRPRVVNSVAHKSLLFASRAGAPQVLPEHVRAAAAATPNARPATVLSRLVARWQQARPRQGTSI
jgi:MSHA biogenesis protein MshM